MSQLLRIPVDFAHERTLALWQGFDACELGSYCTGSVVLSIG